MAFEVGATVLILGLASTELAAHQEVDMSRLAGARIELQAGGESGAAPAAPAPGAPETTAPETAAPGAPAPPKAKPSAPPAEGESGEGDSDAAEEGSEGKAEEGAAGNAEEGEAGAAGEPVDGAAAPTAPTNPSEAAPGVAPAALGSPSEPAPVTPGAVDAPAVGSPADAPLVPASPAPAASGLQAPAPVESAQQAAPANPSEFQVGLTGSVAPVAPGNAAQANVAEDKPNAQNSLQLGLAPGQPVMSGLSIALGAQMSVGYSTFLLGSEFERDPMVDWSLSLSPAYFFADNTRISASTSLSQELTLSGGDDEPQTLIFGDIGLSVSRPLYRFEGGPSLLGSLSMQLPTSEASRAQTLVTSLGGRLSAAQPLGKFFLSLGTAYRKNFHRYTNPARDPSTGDPFVTRDGLVIEEIVTGLARSGGSELSGTAYFEGENSNTSMVWSNSLAAVYSLSDHVSLMAIYSLSHSWAYNSYELDELSGEGARAGRGRSDSHGGTLAANYQLSNQLGFGFGMSTFGPTRTADDKRIRFPFFAFEGKENNLTVFSLSVSYTESIGL